jgi:3-phosphoshikimate 1-carboxyvinyltransferase
MSEIIELKPAIRCRGLCIMPGDKSLSQRALILAALAKGQSRIENLATSDDVRATIRVLRNLGTTITLSPEGTSGMVEGRGGNFDPPDSPLDCGNSATTMRLMAGVLAAQNFVSILTGDESLCRRPMGGTIEPLRQMGADITSAPDGRPPLTIRGRNLTGISLQPSAPSAQIKSAVILAGLFATGDTVIHESLQTRDHTERLLSTLAGRDVVSVDRMKRSITVNGENIPLRPFDIVIPGDPSSAAYPIALATLLPESTFTAPFVSLNAGRIAFYRHLQAMGAHVVMTPDSFQGQATLGEPVGEIMVISSKLKNVPLDPTRIPAMIDEIPLLAVVACLSDRPWEITGAERLREKETDRITTTVEMLRAMGAEIVESRDGLGGMGNQTLSGGTVDCMGDHRIAMSAAIAAWCAKGPTTIRGAECVGISFPRFFACMKDLVEYQ